VSLLGAGGEVQARQAIRQVKFLLGSSSQREFSSANFYMFENLFASGTKSIVVYRLALGMECHVVTSGTQQFDMPSEQASWCALPGAICPLSEAISGCEVSAAPHRSLGLQ